MGRAYEVRKASIQKTGAAKSKLYSMYAKEIYQAAKNGGTDIDTNASLTRIVDRAKKEQVPSDIIKRAIDKVNSGVDENYAQARYELFGPAGSTVIVDCLTDNPNRTISDIRTVLNKCKIKMGSQGSVSYMYDHLCIVGFTGLNEEETLELMIEEGIDVDDIESNNGNTVIYAEPTYLFEIKEAISKRLNNVEFSIDEIAMIPNEKVKLIGEDLETLKKLLAMLEDTSDVQQVYHNVEF